MQDLFKLKRMSLRGEVVEKIEEFIPQMTMHISNDLDFHLKQPGIHSRIYGLVNRQANKMKWG